MLPIVKKTVLSTLVALTLTNVAAPAHAWDQRERDVLKGVVGTIVAQSLLTQAGVLQPRQPRPVYAQPVYQAPAYQPPRVVYTQPPVVYAQPPVVYAQPAYAVSVYRTAAAQAFNSYSLTERRAIQRRLAAAGYYYGGVDGSFGPGTYNAVAAYASDRGLSNRLASREGAFGIFDSLIF